VFSPGYALAAGSCVDPGPRLVDDDGCDGRAGLVRCPLDEEEAVRFARDTDRIVVSEDVDPRRMIDAAGGRSFVIVGGCHALRAVWGAALAAAGSQRHFFVATSTRAPVLRESAPAYLARVDSPARAAPSRESGRANQLLCRAREQLAGGRLSSAARIAGRAALLAAESGDLVSEAIAVKGRALRFQGASEQAYSLLIETQRQTPVGATPVFLIEAAEAATDCARLERGEAFARAAFHAATTAEGQRRAGIAMDRARLWRGESVESGFWAARAAWHVWGREPWWPEPGGYPHARCGPLARWEWLLDRFERSIWHGDRTEAARRRRQLFTVRDRLPALLQLRFEWLAERGPARARRLGAHGVLRTGKAGAVMEVFERMSEMLRICQDADGGHAMRDAASRLREALRAKSVAIHVAGRALPVAGDGIAWNVTSDLAARCAVAVDSAGPERADAGWRAAVSIKAGGAPIGAILATWPAHAAVDERQARLLLESAALVLAPLLREWRCEMERPQPDDMPEIVGTSAAIEAVRDGIRRVARVGFPVLIEGESGAGKELVARAIHRLSSRSARPFRALNCAAMAEDLVEAELFGHAQGAFTGAASARGGLFEDADRGTLFLDEVTELSVRAQAKLLRVLQDGEVRRVGETAPRRVDVRIIAATNRAVHEAVAARAFRADLSFRLDVLRIDVPPLRRRPEDIALLCAHFWRDAASRAGTAATLSADALGTLAAHEWPGNVRELQNVIAALAVSAPKRGRVTSAHLPARIGGGAGPPITLHQARMALERDLVQRALARSGGRQAKAAAELGLTRQGLAKLMRRLGLPAA